MRLRDLASSKPFLARTLVAAVAGVALFGLACSKSQPEGNAGTASPAASGNAAPAGGGAAADNGAAAAAPAGSPDAHEQALLDQAKKATTPDERRQAYAQLVRMHPENKAYKHELKKARQEARRARRAGGAEAVPSAPASGPAH